MLSMLWLISAERLKQHRMITLLSTIIYAADQSVDHYFDVIF
jgi:hypothetical protein